MTIFSRFSQTLLYFFGPFYGYPWKPFVNAAAGDSYAVAYKYFRRDNQHPVNLALHSICLYFQLIGNFALLSAVDAAFPPSSYLPAALHPPALPGNLLSLATLLLWSGYLLLAPAPLLCTVAAVGSLVGCYFAGALLSGPTIEFWTVVPFSVVLIFGLFMCPPKQTPKSPSAAKVVLIGVLWIGWLFFWEFVDGQIGSSLASRSRELSLGLVVCVFLLSSSRHVPEGPAIGGALVCRLVAILTGQPILFLWGCSFTAPLLQGTAHRLTGETATLIKHNRD